MPLFRRTQPDEPLTALGRPWRSSVEPGLRTGLFDDEVPDRAASDRGEDDARADIVRAALDPDIVSDLDDFADAVESLTPGDMGRLYAFWRNIDEEARMSAYDRAQAAAEETGRRDVIRQFQDELLAWSQVHSRRGRVATERMLIPTDDPVSLAAGRYEIRSALVDTMVALALQDELDDEDFDTLFGPWRDAMGDDEDGSASPTGIDPPPAP